MSILSLFGGDSKSSTTATTNSYDQKVGASDSGVANRSDNNTGTIFIGSDLVANNAINASVAASNLVAQATGNAVTNVLAATSNALETAHQDLNSTESFLSDKITQLFQNLDAQSASVNANITAAQQIAGDVVGKAQQSASDAISKSQQTSVDDFMKLIWGLGAIGLAIYAIKSGVFK